MRPTSLTTPAKRPLSGVHPPISPHPPLDYTTLFCASGVVLPSTLCSCGVRGRLWVAARFCLVEDACADYLEEESHVETNDCSDRIAYDPGYGVSPVDPGRVEAGRKGGPGWSQRRDPIRVADSAESSDVHRGILLRDVCGWRRASGNSFQ